jgi:hypothetical protein
MLSNVKKVTLLPFIQTTKTINFKLFMYILSLPTDMGFFLKIFLTKKSYLFLRFASSLFLIIEDSICVDF